MKNPPWQRDELILALDFYFSSDYNKLSNKHEDVIKLSEKLNKLPIFSKEQRTQTFRNPDGVYMKLGNFLAIDPEDPREGLPRFGKLDKIVFKQFINDKGALRNIVNIISNSLENKSLSLDISDIKETAEEEFAKEGKIVFRLHKLRERNLKIVKKKKQDILKKYGTLKCEVCEFDFYKFYGSIGEGFIECHHTKPLSTMGDNQDITHLRDLAIVCSNCHKMLHRTVDFSIKSLKEMISKNREINLTLDH